MIAAIYARKSTDQAGVSEDQRSVARQIDHAKAYAARRGWAVDDAYIYDDDGISGAEFARRPGFLRLINALSPRAPFQVLIMSEEARLGREAIETAYALKQIIQAGVRVFFYLEDRERTFESPTDKLLMSVTAFADELEREKARQRTYDAMRRKALAKHVTGGRVFGYDNVGVSETDASGRSHRLYVTRRINEAEAPVVRRIFQLCADGYGVRRIAATLNAEGACSPKAQRGRPTGWASSSVRALLFRSLYRGAPVWNQTRKRDAWGRHRTQDRPAEEWLHLDVPEWRIVSDELWRAAHARLESARANYLAGTQGMPWGRPSSGTATKYLLTGIGRCGICGGGLVVRGRKHGKARQNRYACSTVHYRGRTVCANSLEIPVDAADGAILDMLSADVLRPEVIERAIDRAMAALNEPDNRQSRRATLDEEIARLDAEIANLTNALAAGGDLPAILSALKSRESRRNEAVRERETVQERARKPLERSEIEAEARRRLQDWRGLCGRQTAETRKLLDLTLNGRIVFTPTRTESGAPAYELRAPLTFERIFSGLLPALPLTKVTTPPGGSQRMASPRGLDTSCGQADSQRMASPAGVEPASPP